MVKLAVFAVALTVSGTALAIDGATPRTVDLREPHALEQLQQANPAHFAKIQQVLAGLQEQPQRAEGDWLRVTFDARDVDLSRYVIWTSNPPKQLLRFTLEDVRYVLYVSRNDLTATVVPAK